MSEKPSRKREYSLWNNEERKWWKAGKHYEEYQVPKELKKLFEFSRPLDVASSFYYPSYSTPRSISAKEGPVFLTYSEAQKWLNHYYAYVDGYVLSIQKKGTNKEVRQRVIQEIKRAAALATHGIWDSENNEWYRWIDTYDLPSDLRGKYSKFSGAFMSLEDISKWYQYLRDEELDDEDMVFLSVQPKASADEIKKRVADLKKRQKFAEKYL